MDYPEHGIRLVDHEDERERWSFALRRPAAPLRGLVRGYCLFDERRTALPLHQHLPHRDATFIVGLEGRIEVEAPASPRLRVGPGEGFLAGLHTTPARTRSERCQRGIQIDLTVLGAHRLLAGEPMHALANRAFGLDELLGREGRELGEALAERAAHGGGAETAFEALDAFLGRRLLDAPRRIPSEALCFAWRTLEQSHGAVPVGAIGRELGWSRKRLVAGFREHVGLAPKATARLLRFDHAMARWKARPGISWLELALEAGYGDQAHFVREVRALSGQTPTQLAARLLPASGSLAAD